MSVSDPIWINDFNILLKPERAMEFFPLKEHTQEERLNAIVRLSLYISIVLFLYYSNAKYLGIFVFSLCFTYIIYKHHPELNLNLNESKSKSIQQQVQEKAVESRKEEESNPKLNNFTPFYGTENLENEIRGESSDMCTKPTIDNPFMNATMKDYMNFDSNGFIVDRPPACDPSDPDIKKMIDDSFNNNLYKDVSDVFGKMSSQRNYFTMPWTTIPNKQDEVARWLYLSPKTCKEDQDNCLQYEDLRSKRFMQVNPERNPVNSSAKLN